MSYSQLTRRLGSEDHLFSALVELTYRCNLDCYFCYNDLSLKGRTLSKEQYFRFFEDLAEMRVMNLVLSGGEPLSHPDFFELGAHAKKLGFVVRVKSNGHALNRATAKRLLKEVDPYLIDTSLHGGSASTHDRQTRVPGSFDRLLENIAECRSLGMKVKINTTLTRWNEGEIDEIFDIADRLDCQLQVDPEVTPRDDGDAEPLEISPTTDGIRRLFEIQSRRVRSTKARVETDALPLDETPAPVIGRQDAELMKAPAQRATDGQREFEPKHCGAGSVGVAVNPFGDVFPCVQWRRSIGNLHNEGIQEIWADRSRLADVRQVTKDAVALIAAEGDRGKFMAFCPGLAHSKSGNPLEVYESSRERGEVILHTLADLEDRTTSAPESTSTSTEGSNMRQPTPSSASTSNSSRQLPVVG